MKIPLNSPARTRLIAGLVLAFTGIYLGLAAREFVASWLGNRTQLTSLKAAAWIDSGNAAYRNQVGRYYDLVARDPIAALAFYKAAVQLNPHSAAYWFDLASAYQILADSANQTAALEHAIRAEPTKPDVAWTAANYYLVQGDNENAIREFRVVMANDPSLAASAIGFCWRINPDVDLLLRDAVPPTATANLAFLSLLETKQETAGTFKVWNALLESQQPFEKRDAYDYIQYLIKHKEVDQATLVWKEAADRFGLTSYLPSPGNLVINSTFSLDPLNHGFDWQYQKQSGVDLMLDPSTFHGGRRSFSITFDGPGIADAGLYQFVAVQPNTAYDFSAYYKNGDNADGAGGPHFTIQDMYSQAIYFESDELKDAGFWKPVDGEFTTGPDCKLVVLHIRRLPEGYPIRGKLWVDDFHIVRKPS